MPVSLLNAPLVEPDASWVIPYLTGGSRDLILATTLLEARGFPSGAPDFKPTKFAVTS